MKLSIITTVYNAVADLPRLLDSMMAQKSSALEFFLIDNGSTDNSRAICEEYAKRDRRFTIFVIKNNVGYIRARNIGIKEVKADYIGFCDSDDYLVVGAYDRAIERIKDTNCDLYLTSYRTLCGDNVAENKLPYECGLYAGNDVKNKILPLAFGPYNGKEMLHGFMWKEIFHHDLLLANNLSFMIELKPYEDQLLNVQAISLCKTVYVDDNPIYNYIVNPQSITAQMAKHPDYAAEWNRIVSLYNNKAKYATNAITGRANANVTLRFIYGMILSMVRYEKNPQKTFYENIDDSFVQEVLQHIDVKGSLSFVGFCLKHRLYSVLFITVGLVLKMR